MEHPKFIIKTTKIGQHYFSLTAKNGQVLATSDLYSSKDACENGIYSVKCNAELAEIDDRTEVLNR